MTKFVRITYQECESVEGQGGAYKPLGLKQDIRLMNGHFLIGDDQSALTYNIVVGKLYRIGEEELHVAT